MLLLQLLVCVAGLPVVHGLIQGPASRPGVRTGQAHKAQVLGGPPHGHAPSESLARAGPLFAKKDDGQCDKTDKDGWVPRLIRSLFGDQAYRRQGPFRARIEDPFLLYGDLAAIFVVAVAQQLGETVLDPSFPGWDAPLAAPHLPDTLAKVCALSLSWVSAGLYNDAYTRGASYGEANSMAATGNTWVSCINIYLLGSLFGAAALGGAPLPVPQALANAFCLLGAMLAWRGEYGRYNGPLGGD